MRPFSMRTPRREESLVEEMVAAAPTLMLVLDAARRVTHANPAFEAACGYRLSELRERSLSFVPLEDGIAELRPRSGGGRRIEWTVRAREGGGGWLCYGIDVTERLVARARERRLELRLRAVLDGLFTFVGVYDLDGNVIEVNRAPVERAGLQRSDVIGVPFWEAYWWSYSADTQAEVRAILRRAAAGETIRSDLKVRLGEDRLVLLDTMFGPLRGPDGTIDGIVGSGVDVTDRRLAEEERSRAEERVRASLREKETLLREVHHRVKNNLQVISGLLHFQAKRIHDPRDLAAFEEGRMRLLSMMLVHELLYRSPTLSRVDFAAYVSSLVARLSSFYQERPVELSVRVEPTELPVDTALPCGMILCELITNIYKHAFVGRADGRAQVLLQGTSDGLMLTVSDDGRGVPLEFDPTRVRSFGWRLIGKLVEQLGGDIDVESEHGATVRVSIPLEGER